MIKWLFVAFVFLGDACIILKNRKGFIIWMICDGFFCVTSLIEKRYAESLIFGLYSILGIFGYIKWSKND